ncbi:MAG TPA: acetoin utilization protein AcuC [Mycobacteriales bacterium]|nr:acetoin utilization protein AcuC [Mycobacteriales bacterium]
MPGGCGETVALVRSAAAARYDLGHGHPMRAARAELAIELATSLGVLERPSWREVAAQPAEMADLGLVHDLTYLAVVRSAERMPEPILQSMGLATEDTPIFPGIHDAASAVVGATQQACFSVWHGETVHAVNLLGGLHHAMPGFASGFCVYNDLAVGIKDLLRNGCRRVAYIDLDAHHGDGVEAVFRDDPRVLTISLHQDGRTIFPGTGAATDIGVAPALGYAVNVPLPPGTGNSGWLRALSAVVPVLLREFRPEVIVTQCGCDAHRDDPLTDLSLTTEGFAIAYSLVHDLAHELCEGRWVIVGGGGYDLGSAVPRTWAQLLAEVSGGPLPASTELPQPWRQLAERMSGQPAPVTLGDEDAAPCWRKWDAGEGDPDDAVDRSVAAARREVLPLHGLDPLSDR